MQICKFSPQQPQKQVSQIIKDLFFTQKIRSFKVEKPFMNIQLSKKASQMGLNLKKSSSFVYNKQQQTFQGFQDIIVKPVNSQLKTKIIKKIKQNSIDKTYQRKIQKLHNQYLLNHMHKTNQINIKRQIPPDLSVLQTIDQGDYQYVQDIKDFKNPPKRQHPHSCNVLPLTKIQKQTPKIKTYLTPLKAPMGKNKFFSIDDNSVIKIKVVNKFVLAIFKMDSQQLEPIAEKVGTSTKNVKLLFDMLSDFFKLEKQLRKQAEPRNKAMKKIRKRVKKALMNFSSPLQSVYVPKQQHYISLSEIKQLFRNPSKDSDSQRQ